jgi:hypothetical protein
MEKGTTCESTVKISILSQKFWMRERRRRQEGKRGRERAREKSICMYTYGETDRKRYKGSKTEGKKIWLEKSDQ